MKFVDKSIQRSNEDGTGQIRIWDLPTRLFHWTLVMLIALQFATAQFGLLSMQWHYRFGYATLALIVFRLIWGVVGSQTSRFAEFISGPSAITRYLREQLSRDASQKVVRDNIGHNALGAWSVIAMLVCVLMQAVTGLFSSDGIDEDGPFVGSVSNATVKSLTHLHHLGETVLLALIALHIIAVLLHWWLKHDNLIVPMLTGRKRIDAPRSVYFVANWRALLAFILAIASVVILSRFGD